MLEALVGAAVFCGWGYIFLNWLEQRHQDRRMRDRIARECEEWEQCRRHMREMPPD
jgi:hypothetical protein